MLVVCNTNSTLQYIYCIVGDDDNCTVSSTVIVTTVPSTVTVTAVPSTVTVTPSWCIAHNATSYSPLCSPSSLSILTDITITSENFPYYIGTLVLVLILLCCCIFGWTCCICCFCIHKRTQKNEPIMYTTKSKSYV